jgi:hypothetical protein
MPSIAQLVNRIRETEFPVLKHEFRMRRKLKGLLTSTPYIGVGVLLAWLFVSAFANIRDPDGNQAAFGLLSFILLIIVCVLIPARSAGMIAVERERHTFDLLALTLLPSSGIIVQKLIVSVTEAVVVVTAAVPTLVVTAIRGGVPLLDIVTTYVILMATALFVAAGGIFWSCILRDARTATFVTYASMVGLFGVQILGLDFLSLITGVEGGSKTCRVIATVVAAVSLLILYTSIGRAASIERAASGRKVLGVIGPLDAVMVSAGTILAVFLAMPGGPDLDSLRMGAICAANPLLAISVMTEGTHDACAVLLGNLGFAAAGTAYLLCLSVRKLEALRCS